MALHDQETVPLSHGGAALGAALREIRAPRQLGSVRLIREIGKGGMGIVWLGHDDMLGRDVAVKFLLGASPCDDDPNFVTFLEGARAAARLKCPGMTAIFHADVIEGAPYIVMEYVDGPPLSRVIGKVGALTLPAAFGIMRSVCDTTAQLHGEGIIHRDIKPANIMLDTDCRVFLTDFGIAISRPMGETAGEPGPMTGTPAYMAPEMFDGFSSTRTDVYALGITLYEMLAGEPPFKGELSDVRDMHRQRELPLAPLHQRGVTPDVIEYILRATHKDPKFRPKTARHMLESLDRVHLPPHVRERADTELRSAALRCRAGGVDTPIHETISGTPGGRSLYDHLSTLAAKKRSDTPPPAPAPAESQSWGIDTDPPAPDPTPSRIVPMVMSFVCTTCRAQFATADPRPACPSCGASTVGPAPSRPASAEAPADKSGPSASLFAWIGLGIIVLAVVVALIVRSLN